MKNRIYLDNCCFNRPFDDPVNLLVRLEAEAKTHIQAEIRNGKIELAWSFILDYENTANPYEERRLAIAPWKHLAIIDVGAEKAVYDKACAIEKRGIRDMDALHIACAIQAHCRFFLTTDKKVLKKKVDGIAILNPLSYIQEVEGAK